MSREIDNSKELIFDAKEYWLNKLKDDFDKSVLPYDRNRKDVSYNEIKFNIDSDTVGLLNQLSNGNELKTFIILTTTVFITLNKINRDSDLIIGVPVFKQDESVILQNTLLTIRNYLDENKTFVEILKEVSKEIFNSNKQQNFPVENILYHKGIDYDSKSDFPLFDISVSLENLHDLNYINRYRHNLKFSFKMTENQIEGKVIYNSSYYFEETIINTTNLFKNVLFNSLQNKGSLLSEISGVSNNEKDLIINQFNGEIGNIDPHTNIIQLFEKKVSEAPNDIATIYKKEKITYKELSYKVNQFAQLLLTNYGASRDKNIGVILNRSNNLMVTILAVLKSGASFVPIDPKTPVNRINEIIANSNIKVAISDFFKENELASRIEIISPESKTFNDVNCEFPKINSEDIAYILYTSGTSGKPKGVMVPHYAVVDRMYWMKDNFKLTPDDIILQKTSISFDVSICELFRWIHSGSKVCFIDDDSKKDISLLVDFIHNEKITTIDFIPNELDILLDYVESINGEDKLKSLRWVYIGAEVVKSKLVEKFNRILNDTNEMQLINEYGPTEATVDVTYFNCTKDFIDQTSVPIGKPIANNHIYITDKFMNLLPVGIPGELCISGNNLAKGYLNDSQLTEKKFISNPYVNGQMLYKTGDIAAWLPDGNIEFIGRKDKQVKINGHRIELHDIENKILLFDVIDKVHIEIVGSSDQDNDFNKVLCAYVITKKNCEFNKSDLILTLKNYFPDYLIPKYFFEMEEFPLKESGKLNTDDLPKPESLNETIIAPQNEFEKQLRLIWSGILNINENSICISDNFFELGGNSLSVNLMASKIYQRFSKKISLIQIFEKPNIKDIAELIKNESVINKNSLKPAIIKDYYQLTSGQQRLFFLQELDTDSMAYNLPFIVEFKSAPDIEKIDNILNQIIGRHESLRTSFKYMDETVKQIIHPKCIVKTEFVDLKDYNGDLQHKIHSRLKPFNLDKAPLFRPLIIRTPELKYLFLIDMHHIIADAFSHGYLIQDFIELLDCGKLTELKYQYKDFGEWEHQAIGSKEFINQKEFWINQFKDNYQSIEIPLDMSRPDIRSFNGESLSIDFTEVETKQITDYLTRNDCTVFMFFLTVYNIFLSKLADQDDIVIGVPVDTRDQEVLKGVVGNFTNMIAIRNYIDKELSVKEFIREIKMSSINCLENKEFPFEELIKELGIVTTPSRNSLVDVALNVVEFDLSGNYSKYFRKSEIDLQNNSSKYDLFLRAYLFEKNLEMSLEYSSDILHKDSIEKYLKALKHIIISMLKNDLTMIDDISINDILEIEKSEITEEISFNL